MQRVAPCLIIVLTVVHHAHEPHQYTGVQGAFRTYMELGDQSGQMRVNDRYLHTHLILPSTELAVSISVELAQAHSNNVCVCVLFPVRICSAGLCVQSRQFVCIYIYIYIYIYMYIYMC